MKAALIILATLLPAILLSGCYTTSTETVSKTNIAPHYFAPAMQYSQVGSSLASEPQTHSQLPIQNSTFPAASAAHHPTPQLSRQLTGRLFLPASFIERELATQASLAPGQIEFSDRLYVLPSHDWVISTFLPYIESYFEQNQIRNIGEGLDCDNIAHLFRHQLILSNAQGGGAHAGDIPCGILKTQQQNTFGGVEGDGSYHSLILLRTDKGWHAIEPQTQKIAALSQYPNTPHIDWALF